MSDEHTNQLDDQVETLLRDASTAIRPDNQTRQAIRARVLGKDASDGDTSSAAEHNGGRKRRRFAWAASVALVVTGAIIASFVLWPTPLTLAAVVEALEDVDWVYIKYDNGEERWRSPTEGVFAVREPVGVDRLDGRTYYRLSLTNYRTGEQYSHFQHPAPRRGYIAKGSVDPKDFGSTAWDWVVKPYEERNEDREKSTGLARSLEVERHEQILDKRRVVRFDSYSIDALGQRALRQQLWTDPESRLPIRVRRRNHEKEREDNPDPGFTNGVFEFPESGPTSLYDLGAARDLPVMEHDVVTQSDQEITRLQEAMRAAERRFPENYRVIHWGNDRRSRSTGIDVIYMIGKMKWTPWKDSWRLDFDGVKGRKAQYFSWDEDDPKYHLPRPATAEQVLAWTRTQTPVSLGLSDGERYFHQVGPYPPRYPDADKVTLRVNRSDRWGVGQMFPRYYQWPIAYRAFVSEVERFQPDPQAPHLIGLRVVHGDQRNEYIIDTAHDYICVEFTRSSRRHDTWFRERTTSWSDLEQLPSGAWFATKGHIDDPGDPERGTGDRRSTWLIHIEEIDPDQLPPDTFDGDLMLEKAKALGATITTY